MMGLLTMGVSKWIGWLAIAVAAATLYFIIDARGYARGKAELTEYIANQAIATVTTQKVVEKIVTEVQIEFRDRIKTVYLKGDTIVKEVPIYVTKDDDSACELRNGFVRVHDGAAVNQPAGAPVDSDRAPSGIALSEALSVIADNYKVCNGYRERIRGWEEYNARLKKAISATCGG